MINCPHCKNQMFVGTLFCMECGAQLVFSDSEFQSAWDFESEPKQDLEAQSYTNAPVYTEAASNSKISLSILETGEVVHLVYREETTLGRVSDGQPIIPDLDLSPFSAYEAGVSRLHASIRQQEGQIIIVDLGSANGTRVNGIKIEPNVPHTLLHGDVLTLGKLKIQVLIRGRY
jgi:pSer/pThr/pTyr-binding forkhead associated (FHA) protein